MTKPEASAPLILWFRRDLRLDDLPMLHAACQTGRPLIPLFIADHSVTSLGAAAKWRLGEALRSFSARLTTVGSQLTLRRGPAEGVLRDVMAETGATGVYWTRRYDGEARDRDGAIKEIFKRDGIEVESFDGTTLIEPWQVKTGGGTPFKVFTPYWNALKRLGITAPVPAPKSMVAPSAFPQSERLEDWQLSLSMNRGAPVVASHALIGEEAALGRLDAFLAQDVTNYAKARDLPALSATSGLSEPLTYGEISPRRIWAAAMALGALEPGHAGAEAFRRELAWRDFAHHLLFAFPELPHACWRPEWERFTWHGDSDTAERWRQARTGEPIVDAGLREMFVTGKMHNRVRMIVASYLTKHLRTDWRVGMAWFDECLTDWDPASNAMGWQWVAGCGPDASPYFRVFNPATQAEKFDKGATYRSRYIAELSRNPSTEALAYFDAIPRRWGLSASDPYPEPMVDLGQGRLAALEAYTKFKEGAE